MMTRLFAATVAALFSTTVASAALLDSTAFTYQYNGDVYPATGYTDFGPFDVGPSTDGDILTYRSTIASGAGYFESNVWGGAISDANGWTIEFRVKVGIDETEGPDGSFQVFARDGVDRATFRVGQSYLKFGAAAPFNTESNTDDFQVIRLAQDPGATTTQVWRNNSFLGSFSDVGDAGGSLMYWADGGGDLGGPTVELDYIRFTSGAFAPVPEPATSALLLCGVIGAIRLARRKRQ